MDDMGDEDCSLAEVKEAAKHISSHFRLPLEVKGVSFVSLQEVVDYARTYQNISQTEYRKVWYTLCSCPVTQNGLTSSLFVNWLSVCHSPMEE